MKSRFLIVLLSVVFATAATVGAAYYIGRLQAELVEGQTLVPVLVAKKSADAGTSGAQLAADGSIAVVKVPKQYVADDALISTQGVERSILAVGLAKGEQITAGKFKNQSETGLAFKVPEGMVAVSIAIDEMTGVGGQLRAGDEVDVFATFSPGPDGQDMTKIMLQKIGVLSAPEPAQAEQAGDILKQQQPAGRKTVTLAVTPSQAEKVVFAAEKGHIWLSLRRSSDDTFPATTGRTVLTAFE
ncbi:MAG: Flp pilus assembly protein CpaB [Candidatus Aquicultorales bacterium]